MRIIYWGTYDDTKPRNRILRRGLREAGVDVIECHATVWSGVEDKSQIGGFGRRLRFLLRWVFSYPGLIVRYLRLPKHDAVVVGYLGQVDVLVLWPFARLRGAAIVWDAFLSLYDTVSGDRKIVGRRHPAAILLFILEWLACRAADRVVLDTRAHAEYFEKTFRVSPRRTAAVFVGVEPERFPPRPLDGKPEPAGSPVTVLFYGQFIPLHGIETIVRAAELAKDEEIDWVLVGGGQEEVNIRHMLAERPLARLTWIPWVDYDALVDSIHRADICLGIFGDTDKAARVIPNKIFQVLATGTPLVTRDSPAIRELLEPDMVGVWLVPPANPAALLAAIQDFSKQRPSLVGLQLHEQIKSQTAPETLGHSLADIISTAVR